MACDERESPRASLPCFAANLSACASPRRLQSFRLGPTLSRPISQVDAFATFVFWRHYDTPAVPVPADRPDQQTDRKTHHVVNLATTVIGAGNARVRKLFAQSSNGLLDIGWYRFAAVFMLGADYSFLKNSHVRIDFTRKHAGRTQALENAAKLVSFVLFILIDSAVFSFTFNATDGHIWAEHLLTKIPVGALAFLTVVNILIFILGCSIDFFGKT